MGLNRTRPPYERGNAYPAPNYLARFPKLGIVESFDCTPAGGTKREATQGEPPCYVQPPSLFDGRFFPRLQRGGAPIRRPPPGDLGATPAVP